MTPRTMRAVLLAGALVWAAPMPAVADSATCSYDAGTRTVTVSVTPSDDFAPILIRDAPGNIQILDSDGPAIPCGATVNNTNTIVINNASPTQPLMTPFYILYREPFTPGFTNESGSSDEVEFVANFGPGGTLGLDVTFSTSDPGVPMNMTLGGGQVNLNAGEVDGIDADVTLNGVTEVYISQGAYDDWIIASGGAGTPPQPLDIDMIVTGSLGGNDRIVGGNGDDSIYALDGNDIVDGGAGNDFLVGDGFNLPGTGDDLISGGPGKDQVMGQAGNDVISGGPGPDSINGGEGDDRASGAAGKDQLDGDLGNDVLRGKAGRDRLYGREGDDFLDGGPSTDHCSGGPGNDIVKRCETGKD